MRSGVACMLALALCACASANPAATVRAMDEATLRREVSARFGLHPPPMPERVEDRAAGQIADAAYFATFSDLDRSYTPRTRAQARRLAERLQAEAGQLSREAFALRVAEIAALADNGHTALYTLTRGDARIPVRFYLFADGLHVLYADAGHDDLLGARIERIDGRSIDDIYRVIRRYQGGTEALRRNRLTPLLESPAALHAAGVAQMSDSLTLSGVRSDGTRFEQRLAAAPDERTLLGPQGARLLFPDALRDIGNVIQGRVAPPLSLQQSSRAFWTQSLAANGFYLRLTQNLNGAAPLAPFLDEVLAQVRAERPSFIVLDMRMNGGGDYTTTYAFARALPEAAGDAPIYVLTSPWTFSAAITTICALKEVGGSRVTIVGEEVGDRLDFWAEGGIFLLPNTRNALGVSTGRHVYNSPCNDLDQCFWLNYLYPVRVRTLRPDIAAPWTFAAYREGRDPALDAVLARETRAGSNADRR